MVFNEKKIKINISLRRNILKSIKKYIFCAWGFEKAKKSPYMISFKPPFAPFAP